MPLPLSSEELQNVEWFLKARKMSMRENVTKCVTSAFLKCQLTLLQKVQKQEEFNLVTVDFFSFLITNLYDLYDYYNMHI